MNITEILEDKILAGGVLNREEAMKLADEPLERLCSAANRIRKYFCGNIFDMCTIVNAKSGRCSEDCKYCAQSAFYASSDNAYPLLETASLTEGAKRSASQGVLRYSMVTAGRSLSEEEINRICDSIRNIKNETDIELCVSFGLLSESQFKKLKEAGVSRVHCNLETSESYFPEVCTTHSYQDKIQTITAAKAAGLSVCSGGIIGLGETMADRIDMGITARNLGVKSIPVNMLNPIPGTPYENNAVIENDEMCRTTAVFRFLLPDAFIRLAGGRGLLPDKGRQCFMSGANAAISGDMLTTSGISVKTDMTLLAQLGYEVRLE